MLDFLFTCFVFVAPVSDEKTRIVSAVTVQSGGGEA